MNGIEAKFDGVFTIMKDTHSPEFNLHRIFEVYFPFYQCKVNIVAETADSIDQFSRIVLSLVEAGMCEKEKIYGFLGIETVTFLNSHLDFLIKAGYLNETHDGAQFELAYAGRQYLQGIIKFQHLETVTFEFWLNGLAKDFFLPQDPIDHGLGQVKKKKFESYKLLQTKRIVPNDHLEIPFGKKMQLGDIPRTKLVEAFKRSFPAYSFYDFDDGVLEAHQRSISFLVLLYEDEAGSPLYEVRRGEKTLTQFDGYDLEEKMSHAFSQFMKENPRVLEKVERGNAQAP